MIPPFRPATWPHRTQAFGRMHVHFGFDWWMKNIDELVGLLWCKWMRFLGLFIHLVRDHLRVSCTFLVAYRGGRLSYMPCMDECTESLIHIKLMRYRGGG